MVKINGEFYDVAGQSLMEYLQENQYDLGKLAVEKNNEIVPKRAYATTILQDQDKVEIVCFVGGG